MAGRLNSVQVLRALAVLAVLQVHFFSEFPYLGRPMDGAFGVDLFFVISGFVIAGSLRSVDSRIGAAHFLINRFSRVAPYYWLITAGVVFGLAHMGFPTDWNYVRRSMLFVPIDAQPILAVGWTLCHEAFFYIFCSICAFGFGKGVVRLIIGLFLAVIVFAHFIPSHLYAIEFLKSSMNLYFVMGAMVSILGERLLNLFRGPAALPLSIALALFATLYCGSRGLGVPKEGDFFLSTYERDVVDFRLSFVHSGFPRAFVFGLPATLLLTSFLAREDIFSSERWTSLRKIGDASYSIYLLQGLFMAVVVVDVAKSRPLSRVLMVYLIISVSFFFSREIEARLIRVTKRLLRLLVPSEGGADLLREESLKS